MLLNITHWQLWTTRQALKSIGYTKMENKTNTKSAREALEFIKKFEHPIMKFNRDDGDLNFIPGHHPPKEDGVYLTIRCGRGGIYTSVNFWKDGHWQNTILDDSRVIAYQWHEELNEYFKV